MSRILALVAVCWVAWAAEVVRPSPSTSAYFRVELGYDDNPFLYSAGDLGSFRSGFEPDRFPIQTADDLEAEVSAGLVFRYRRQRPAGKVRLRLKTHQFASNHEKSYGLASAEVEQGVWRGGKLSGSVLWMPSYLIRHYQSRLVEEEVYSACRFAEYLIRLGLSQQLGVVSIRPEYGYEVDDYLAAFDYYDTKAHRLAGQLTVEPADGLEFAGEYEYKLASAAGPVPDISYGQHRARVSAASRPRPLRDLVFRVWYEHAHREFLTGNSAEIDPGHAERVDAIQEFGLSLRYQFQSAALELGFARDWRAATSPYSERIVDIKEYTRNRVSLGCVVGMLQ